MLLDTHAVVWLHIGSLDRFTPRARLLLDTEPLRISPPVLLEIDYLYEIGRTTGGSEPVLGHLGESVGLQVADISAADLFRHAATTRWTRDPFDRLIATHARILDEPLLTHDEAILDNLSQAIW